MENTLQFVDKTAEQCDTLSTCHYILAEKKKFGRFLLGISALILNVLIGSVLVANLGGVIPDHVKWIAAMIALLVSLLVALQTFFNFEEEEKKHRLMGNDFNRISRSLAHLRASWKDEAITKDGFGAAVDSVMEEYEKVCAENEKCPPSRKVATKLEKSLREVATKLENTLKRSHNPSSDSVA